MIRGTNGRARASNKVMYRRPVRCVRLRAVRKGRGGTGRRRATRAAGRGLVVALAAGVLGTTAIAGASSAAGLASAVAADHSVTVQVTAGLDGQYVPLRPTPVTITVTSARLLRAELVVRSQLQFGPQTQFSQRVPIEVPAASAKTVSVVLPSSTAFGPAANLGVVADLVSGSDTLATGSASAADDVTHEVVGLLGSIAQDKAIPKTANLTAPLGTASFVPITDELAALPGALTPADQIAIRAADLQGLAPLTRSALLEWVSTGGQLLVLADAGAPLAALPAPWQPAAGRRTAADIGSVRRFDPSAAWWNDLDPSPARGATEDWLSNFRQFGAFPVGPIVAREAGLRVARIAWLGLFLVAYVLLIGLALPIGLRVTGRSNLLWIAVPLAAVLFTSGAWVAGRSLRAHTVVGHVTLVSSSVAGVTADTWIGGVSRNGGDFSVDLPPGWTGEQPTQFNGDAFDVRQRLSPRGAQLVVPLASGQFGLLQAHGPATGFSGGLEVAATSSTNGAAHVVVTNKTGVKLERVGVFVDQGIGSIDALVPGERREIDLTSTDATNQGGPPPWMNLWGDAGGFNGPPSIDALPVPGAIDEVSRRVGSGWLTPGVVRVVGWTRDAPSPLRAGSAQAKGRTAVVGTGEVVATGGLTDAVIRRAVVRGPSPNGNVDPSTVPLVLAFDLPPTPAGVSEADRTGRLRLRRPANIGGVDVLVNDKWVSLTDSTGTFELPVASGVVNGDRGFPQGQPGIVFATTAAPAFPVGPSGLTPVPAPLPPGAFSAIGAATTAVALPNGGGADGGAVAAPDSASNLEFRLPAGAVHDGRVYVRASIQNQLIAGLYVVEVATP